MTRLAPHMLQPAIYLEALLSKNEWTEACSIWPYAKTRKGYAQGLLDGRMRRVSRYVCQRVHGDPPSPSHHAAHSCHAPSCINPYHLRWATHEENELEKPGRKVILPGARNHKARLTESQVAEIRRRSGAGEADEHKLSREFGITWQGIHLIVRGLRWRVA